MSHYVHLNLDTFTLRKITSHHVVLTSTFSPFPDVTSRDITPSHVKCNLYTLPVRPRHFHITLIHLPCFILTHVWLLLWLMFCFHCVYKNAEVHDSSEQYCAFSDPTRSSMHFKVGMHYIIVDHVHFNIAIRTTLALEC